MPARYISRDPKTNVTSINKDDPVSWIGSDLDDGRNVWQVRLQRGEVGHRPVLGVEDAQVGLGQPHVDLLDAGSEEDHVLGRVAARQSGPHGQVVGSGGEASG